MSAATAREPSPTRDRIRAAAESLFAREGIDRVTLRQIARAAGQRNVAAVQYHFGGRDALLAEILERHLDEIDARRRTLLDEQEHADRTHDIDSLLHVLVEPLAERLDDPSGRAYLQIQAQRLTSPESLRPATRLMAQRIRRAFDIEREDPMRDRFVVLLLFHALADRVQQEDAAASDLPTRAAFIERLSHALRGLYEGMRERVEPR